MLEKLTFLSGMENRETFFRRIAAWYPIHDPRYVLIQKAYNDAKDAFRDKYREDGGRYFEHLRSVALILMVWLRIYDHHLIVAALLHDIVEDCEEWSIERVDREYGTQVAILVGWLTKADLSDFGGSKEARDRAYHERFRYAPREFFFIKLADRLHNLMTLWGCDEEKQDHKIEETERHYLPYAESQLILLHEIEEALENLHRGYVVRVET